MHIPDWLAQRAAAHPARTALISAAGRWSFAELEQRANLLAAQLVALGLQPGERVAVLARNSVEYVSLIHAAPRCGAALVLLNTRLTASELQFQLNDSGARALLYDAAHRDLAAHLSVPGGSHGVDDLPPPNLPPLGGGTRHLDLNALHSIIYTSGTTGSPKGAMLSCGNHWWNATASALNLGLHADDCWLAVLPLFHVGGLAIILRGAIYGIPIVLHERFEAHAVNTAIETERVTIISVVATTLQRMLDARGATPYPQHFRCALLGGGPAPRPLLERCASMGVPVAQTYGMTESASQAATLAPGDALRKLGSAGHALLPVGLRIGTVEREAAAGEVGEILLSGPTITSGYVGQPAASAAALRGGWLHTGDLGYRDAEGYLYVVERRSDLIISGGENIYPAEVEAALLAHPAVVEAGVVGMPDAQWGQRPVAAVVLRQPVAATELLAFVRERLASYKLPRDIVVREALPRTASGKLQRARLREEMG
ncbi:o-succinylbenzoate--CoA ligase [Candidatus Oscillochloris fontis]|uniref:o-succinylbenzoate--CoA ligase n=1 Tax=Candidatus Oscillochloris fontis TaxID=2496868 RepID=UPI00101D89E3|nr:o-succinylbenzoate--CoA ligase [Candidatus Oscillochloris fontis]